MRFEDLQRIMYTGGIQEKDFIKILLDNASGRGVMTDVTLFAVIRFLATVRGINIFFSSRIGDFEVKPMWFSDEVTLTFTNTKTNSIDCTINMELAGEYRCVISFKQIGVSVVIDQDLLDYSGKKDTTMDLRMRILNEMVTRYYSRLLYRVYKELQRRE